MSGETDIRYFRPDGTRAAPWRLKSGSPAHVLSREDRAKGGRARAAKARERRDSLLNERRGSRRLEEAAERLGQLLRSNNLVTAEWADGVIKRHILPEPCKHVPFPYLTELPYDDECDVQSPSVTYRNGNGNRNGNGSTRSDRQAALDAARDIFARTGDLSAFRALLVQAVQRRARESAK